MLKQDNSQQDFVLVKEIKIRKELRRILELSLICHCTLLVFIYLIIYVFIYECLLSFGAESFVFWVSIQKFKD